MFYNRSDLKGLCDVSLLTDRPTEGFSRLLSNRWVAAIVRSPRSAHITGNPETILEVPARLSILTNRLTRFQNLHRPGTALWRFTTRREGRNESICSNRWSEQPVFRQHGWLWVYPSSATECERNLATHDWVVAAVHPNLLRIRFFLGRRSSAANCHRRVPLRADQLAAKSCW